MNSELRDQGIALMRWFHSQEMDQGEAIICMAYVLGFLMGKVTDDEEELNCNLEKCSRAIAAMAKQEFDR